MVEDIFNLSNNRLTMSERVAIAKKVAKELGYMTFYETAEVAKNSGNLTDDMADSMDNLLNEEKNGLIRFIAPFITLELREEVIRIRTMPAWNISDELNKSDLAKFYTAIIRDRFVSFTIRDNDLDYSALYPQISDDHFESYMKALLMTSKECFNEVRERYLFYRESVQKS